MHCGRGFGLHHEAGRHRSAVVTTARVALPIVAGPSPETDLERQSFRPDLERIEVELLLEGIFRHYGFDFRSYARASTRRRWWKRSEEEGLASGSGLRARVRPEPEMREKLLLDLSINVTA